MKLFSLYILCSLLKVYCFPAAGILVKEMDVVEDELSL